MSMCNRLRAGFEPGCPAWELGMSTRLQPVARLLRPEVYMHSSYWLAYVCFMTTFDTFMVLNYV